MHTQIHTFTEEVSKQGRRVKGRQTEAQRDWLLYLNEYRELTGTQWSETLAQRESDVSQSSTSTRTLTTTYSSTHVNTVTNAPCNTTRVVCAPIPKTKPNYKRPKMLLGSINARTELPLTLLHLFKRAQSRKSHRTDWEYNGTMKNHPVSHEKNIYCPF